MSIRAYEMILSAFGVEYREKGTRFEATCPACHTAWKLCVDKESPAVFRCAKCGFSGNGLTLMYSLYSQTPAEETSESDWLRLSKRRHGLDVEFAKEAGVLRLPSGRWALPGFVSDERRTANLAFWDEKQIIDPSTGKTKNKPVMWPADHHGYWTFGDLQASKAVILTEGFWEGWALKQLLAVDEAALDREFGEDFGSVCIVAIPGVMSFQKPWAKYLKGKHVFFLFNDDKPDKLGRIASEEGFLRTSMLILPYIASMRRMSWTNCKAALKLYHPKTKHLEAIKDVNDCFGKEWDDAQILDCVTKSFEDASVDPDPSSVKREHLSDVLVDLRNYITTNPHMERTFVLCMAIVASARNTEANPLWAFLYAPTGFGKTTLADCFEKSELVHKQDSFTASSFVSGYKPGPGETYTSLAETANGKCLMVMEWTVNMTASNEEQSKLNGVLRRLYEGEFKKPYGNGQVIDLKAKFSMLCCVTDAIRVRNTAFLGERFFRIDLCSDPNGFSKDPNDEEEIEHILRAIQNNSRGIEFTVAKKMVQLATASYIDYILDKYREEPVVPPEFHRRIAYMAQITETLRFKAERNEHDDVEETQRTGVGTRIGTQFTRVMSCVAMILDKPVPDEECWSYIQRAATDSMSSQPFKLCRLFYGFGRRPWLDALKVEEYLGVSGPTARGVLRNLVEIGVLKKRMSTNGKKAYTKPVFALSEKFGNFWQRAKMESFDAFSEDLDVLEGATCEPDVIEIPDDQIIAPDIHVPEPKVYVPSKQEKPARAAKTASTPVSRVKVRVNGKLPPTASGRPLGASETHPNGKTPSEPLDFSDAFSEAPRASTNGSTVNGHVVTSSASKKPLVRVVVRKSKP